MNTMLLVVLTIGVLATLIVCHLIVDFIGCKVRANKRGF